MANSAMTSGPGPVGVTLRDYTAADLPAILELFRVVAAEGRFIGMEAPVDAARLSAVRTADLTDANAFRIVAEVAETVVAELGLHVVRGRAELSMLIDPAHRGLGIGSSLLAAGIGWASDRSDVHKMTLQVWPHNVAAIALYRKFGFSVEGYLHRHWRRASGELWDVVVMGLLL